MTKPEIIETLALDAGITKKKADELVTKLVRIIERSVAKNSKVTISGFGTFYVSKRASRRGINPTTGDALIVPAMLLPRFRAGSQFKTFVRSGK